MSVNYLANLSHFIPELVAIVTMMGLLFIEAAYKDDGKEHKFVFIGAMAGLIAIFFSLIVNMGKPPLAIFTNAVVIDSYSTIIKLVLVLGTIGAVYLGNNSKDIYVKFKSEFAIMCMGVLVGGMLLASANNLLTVYLGIETLSILSYVLAAMKKNDQRSSESGLKYVLYGGLTAGIMLYGMSHIYGVLGSIQFYEIAEGLKNISTTDSLILMPSFLLFFVGIGYKIACVPFHMWSPDVYEGAPLPVTTFFAIVPKVAGIAVLVRVSMVFFGNAGMLQSSWVAILLIIAALTMTVGNITAINQKSVKRMLAFSSIAHAGNMILGVTVLNDVGASAILFYIMTYLFMTLVAFYITSFVADKYDNDHFERFNGLIYRYPTMAIMMTIVMFSLAGLPPLSGFVAKFNIFSAVIEKGYYTIVVIAGINSVISLYYYMRIVRLMVLRPSESNEQVDGFTFINQLVIVVLTVPVLFLGIFWEKLMNLAAGAKIFIN